MREPEPETITLARSGDLRAFESLVRAYQADVWRLAYHLTGNRATAEDVTQEAFLKAFRSIGGFRGEAKFTSWLMRIARNCATDAYRRTRREVPMPEDVEERVAPARGASEDRVRIVEAIRTLPPDLRELFVVVEVLGYSYGEASTILGVRLGTVKSRMHRARAALMAVLEPGELAGEV